eukprot:70525_1
MTESETEKLSGAKGVFRGLSITFKNWTYTLTGSHPVTNYPSNISEKERKDIIKWKRSYNPTSHSQFISQNQTGIAKYGKKTKNKSFEIPNLSLNQFVEEYKIIWSESLLKQSVQCVDWNWEIIAQSGKKPILEILNNNVEYKNKWIKTIKNIKTYFQTIYPNIKYIDTSTNDNEEIQSGGITPRYKNTNGSRKRSRISSGLQYRPDTNESKQMDSSDSVQVAELQTKIDTLTSKFDSLFDHIEKCKSTNSTDSLPIAISVKIQSIFGERCKFDNTSQIFTAFENLLNNSQIKYDKLLREKINDENTINKLQLKAKNLNKKFKKC